MSLSLFQGPKQSFRFYLNVWSHFVLWLFYALLISSRKTSEVVYISRSYFKFYYLIWKGTAVFSWLEWYNEVLPSQPQNYLFSILYRLPQYFFSFVTLSCIHNLAQYLISPFVRQNVFVRPLVIRFTTLDLYPVTCN